MAGTTELDRDGSMVVRGVVPAVELAAMHDLFKALIPEAVAYPRASGGVLVEMTGLARAHPPLTRIARDRRFGALAAAALGARRVALLQDSLLYKPAHEGGSVEWHQDHTYVGFLTPPRVVALRIALLPENDEGGCMRVVDGSHRWGPVGDVRALTESSVQSLLPALTPEQREALTSARSLVLAAGDVSIHHCLTLHGSGPNRSAQPRRTIVLRLFDAECRLDPSRLPRGAEVHFPVEPDGRLSASAFPIVYAEADSAPGSR